MRKAVFNVKNLREIECKGSNGGFLRADRTRKRSHGGTRLGDLASFAAAPLMISEIKEGESWDFFILPPNWDRVVEMAER